MLYFEHLPAVPSEYPRLFALDPQDLEWARDHAYVADVSDPAQAMLRPGKSQYDYSHPTHEISDWRTRAYLIMFCYLYENFAVVSNPYLAMDELIVEFWGAYLLDPPDKARIAQRYAALDDGRPVSQEEKARHIALLRPNYERATALLDAWQKRP